MSGKATAAFAVIGYATCSSIMLVINKVAVHYLPAPSFVLLAQVMSSWIAVKAVGCTGAIDVDELEWKKAISFLPVAAAFLACIFANIKTLQYANVETFIVFRASTPLLVSVAEWMFMGRELPNRRSTLSLLALCGGALAYVMNDAFFVVTGYVWVGAWYLIFCFDQLYIKHAVRAISSTCICRRVQPADPRARASFAPSSHALSVLRTQVDKTPMRSNWGRVFYTNLWASAMLAVMTLVLEPHVLQTFRWRFKPVRQIRSPCTHADMERLGSFHALFDSLTLSFSLTLSLSLSLSLSLTRDLR